MKIAVLYLLAFAISYEALAYEIEKKIMGNYQQSQISKPVINGQNIHTVSWPQANSSNNATDEESPEKHVTLLTEIFIYALIILVYSIYWQNNNKPTD